MQKEFESRYPEEGAARGKRREREVLLPPRPQSGLGPGGVRRLQDARGPGQLPPARPAHHTRACDGGLCVGDDGGGHGRGPRRGDDGGRVEGGHSDTGKTGVFK